MAKRKDPPSDVLTVEQVADYLQLNKLTVYKYIREGRLAASKIGKSYRVRRGDVDTFLESQKLRPGRAPAPKPRRRRGPVIPIRVVPRFPGRPEETREAGAGERTDTTALSGNPLEQMIRDLH